MSPDPSCHRSHFVCTYSMHKYQVLHKVEVDIKSLIFPWYVYLCNFVSMYVKHETLHIGTLGFFVKFSKIVLSFFLEKHLLSAFLAFTQIPLQNMTVLVLASGCLISGGFMIHFKEFSYIFRFSGVYTHRVHRAISPPPPLPPIFKTKLP